jgi:hypothetical protein
VCIEILKKSEDKSWRKEKKREHQRLRNNTSFVENIHASLILRNVLLSLLLVIEESLDLTLS